MTAVDDIIQLFSQELGISPDQVFIAGLGILLLILFILATFIAYFRILVHIAAYSYPVARVKAIGNPYIHPDNLEFLAESNTLHELFGKTKESGYDIKGEEELRSTDIDHMLDRVYIKEYIQLEESVPASITPFFQAFHSLLEIEQIKSAVRSVHAGLPPETLQQNMIPIGLITPELIDIMSHSATLEEIISQLQESIYGNALTAALPDYQETGITFPLEYALDRTAIQEIHKSVIKVDDVLAGPVLEFCGTYTDLVNLMTLFRASAAGITTESADRLFFPGGAMYEEWRLKQFLELPRIVDIIQQISGSEYYESLQAILPIFEQSGNVHYLELELERFLLRKVNALSSNYHLTGGPLIKFIVAKKYEIRNIRALAHALEDGIDTDTVAPFLLSDRVLT
ncbi:MAG TPA: V-type ATPase subunit [Methanoregulaceae archaeon]|nr:V-type ATPase subunit [Methanoregulaceae archaeon]